MWWICYGVLIIHGIYVISNGIFVIANCIYFIIIDTYDWMSWFSVISAVDSWYKITSSIRLDSDSKPRFI